jgi:large subunit ribosomal protein L29
VKASELRTLSEPELQAKSRELRDELFNARVKRATGQLENTAKLRQLRRDVARVETLLTRVRGAKS